MKYNIKKKLRHKFTIKGKTSGLYTRFFPSSTHPPLSLHHPTLFAISLPFLLHPTLAWVNDFTHSSGRKNTACSGKTIWFSQPTHHWNFPLFPTSAVATAVKHGHTALCRLKWDLHAVLHANCKEKSYLVWNSACQGFQPWTPQTQSIHISMGVTLPKVMAVLGFILILNFTSSSFLNLPIFSFPVIIYSTNDCIIWNYLDQISTWPHRQREVSRESVASNLSFSAPR